MSLSANDRKRWVKGLRKAQKVAEENGLVFFDGDDAEGIKNWKKTIAALEEKSK